MKGDLKVIEYLNEALRHELTAVNQYWLHYRMLENWGFKELAARWRAESIEEMRHADVLIARTLFLEGHPNMQTLGPLHIGTQVPDMVANDLHAEIEARNLYADAAHYCHSAKDFVTRDLFEKLMQDEETHIDFLETQRDLINQLGAARYLSQYLGDIKAE
jgi:bacterioferritin